MTLKFEGERRDFVCPHCGIHSLHLLTMRHFGHPVRVRFWDSRAGNFSTEDIKLCHGVYNCVACKKDTYFLSEPPVDLKPEKIIHQYPISTPVLHESVPVDVKKATIEAEKCLSVCAYNACGVMTRRAIQALCQDKKAKGHNLPKQLKDLHNKQVITKDLREWADDLRILGRSGAHPEWEEVSAKDADYAVRFLREVIRYVYINPFERNQHRLKKTKKKEDDPPSDPPPKTDFGSTKGNRLTPDD